MGRVKKYNLMARYNDGRVKVIEKDVSLTFCCSQIKGSTRQYEKEDSSFLYLFALPV